jgi:hypothetical protein
VVIGDDMTLVVDDPARAGDITIGQVDDAIDCATIDVIDHTFIFGERRLIALELRRSRARLRRYNSAAADRVVIKGRGSTGSGSSRRVHCYRLPAQRCPWLAYSWLLRLLIGRIASRKADHAHHQKRQSKRSQGETMHLFILSNKNYLLNRRARKIPPPHHQIIIRQLHASP